MAYTNNVPQANQQIAATQAPIQANFDFINTGVGLEHNFNAAGTGSDMYHLKASMPNHALSPALPAGTNGTYYVNSANAYYYDGTTDWRLNQFSQVLTGTCALTTVIATVAAVPDNVVGFGILSKAGPVIQSFFFISTGGNNLAFSNRMKKNGSGDDYFVEFVNGSAGLNLRASTSSNTYNGTYDYKIWFRPA